MGCLEPLDVSRQPTVPADLDAAEARYRQLLDHGFAIIASHDAGGHLLSMNRTGCELVGCSEAELAGTRLHRLVPAADAPGVDEYLSRLRRNGTAEGRMRVQIAGEPRILYYRSRATEAETIVFATDITEQELARHELRRREEILEAIAFIAATFLRGTWRHDVGDALGRLGRAAHASRAYLFRFCDEGTRTASQIAEWSADSVEAQIDNPALQDLDVEQAGFSRWIETMRAGGAIHGPIATFPASERELLEAQAIRSLAVVPVSGGGRLWGFLGFDDCERDRLWGHSELESLDTAARLLGAAIDRELATAALSASEERFRVLVENIPGVVYLCLNDERYSMLYLSAEVESLTGHPASVFLAGELSFVDLYHPDDAPGIVAEVERAIEIQRSFHLSYRIRHPDGEWRWIEEHGQGVYEPSGALLYLEGTLFDITARTRTQAELRRHALYDSLTGLANRTLYGDRIRGAIRRLRRMPDELFAVLLIDLDRFKVVNDSLGPLVGDRLLAELGERLARCVGDSDTAARLGGDEFGVLLEGLEEPTDAIRIAERIQKAFSAPAEIADHEVHCTAAIGITLSHPRYENAEEMLRDADTAMYRAKTSGPGQRVVFDPNMHQRAVERLHLESALRRAFERGELEVHYQPIVELADDAVVSVEALVRWRHPERGLLLPDSFLDVARDAGLTSRLAVAVLGQATAALRELRTLSPELTLNVNLDPRDLAWPPLVDEVARVLAESEIPPEALTLEITEHAVMSESATASGVLGRLRDLGVGICIDDFGIGYSSLSLLQELPVTAIKLDRSFLGRGEKGRPIVAAIAGLAATLGLRSTGEGVEEQHHVALLREVGYHRAQGYLLGRPATADQLFDLVAERLDR